MKEQMKDTQSEIKQNIQGTRTEGKESDSHRRFGPQGRNEHIRPEQNKETRIQKKNEGKLGNLWDNFKRSSIQNIGVPEGEEQEQEIENLSEQIMKENFPNLVKETDFQEV